MNADIPGCVPPPFRNGDNHKEIMYTVYVCKSRLNKNIQFLSEKSVRKNDYSEDKKM